MALIKTDSLSLGYDGQAVVSGISVEINRGDFLCIVGENGSGKSTLMKTLLGLKAPLSGTVSYGDGLKKSKIGYLPQQTATQKDFPASVREVVISGCLSSAGLFPFFTAKHKETARKNMERLGISDIADRCYRELSGGQQQRVLLARALCASSELLLLDEPVAGLDPIVTAELYDIIEGLNRDGMTVVMVSHDIAASVNYATHILHLGNIPLFFGTKEDYLVSDVGRLLQAPTVCTCIPLVKPLITAVKNSEKFISIAPVTAHTSETAEQRAQASRLRPGTRIQKNTVPRIAKNNVGYRHAVPTESEE